MTASVRYMSTTKTNSSGHALRGMACTLTQSAVVSRVYADRYADVAATNALRIGNPFPCNSVGQIECFLEPGTYDYSIVDIDGGAAVTGSLTVGVLGSDVTTGGDLSGSVESATVAKVRGQATVAPTGWTAVPTLQNSWANKSGFQAAQFNKDPFGVVHLRGTIDTGTKTAGTLITTLASGFRPVTKQVFTIVTEVAATSNTIGELIIDTDGTVKVGETAWTASSYATLNGVEFDTVA